MKTAVADEDWLRKKVKDASYTVTRKYGHDLDLGADKFDLVLKVIGDMAKEILNDGEED